MRFMDISHTYNNILKCKNYNGLLWTGTVLSQSGVVLVPGVTIFGDKAYKKVIKSIRVGS